MATGTYLPISPKSPEVYHRIVELPEKASQTFKKGAPLVFNGGYLEEAGAAPSTIAFIAARDGQNGGSDGTYNSLAYRVVAGDQWYCSFEDAYGIADIGGNFGLVKDSTSGYWFADEGDTADQVFVLSVVQTPSIGAVGDTKGQYIVEFQTANIAGA